MSNAALVVGGGGLQGLPVIRCLKSLGWKPIVADSIKDNINRFEAAAYYVAPPVSTGKSFTDFLIKVVEAENIEAIFPTTNHDLPVLADLRSEFEALGVRVFASSPDLVALLADKKASTDAARDAGLNILPSIEPETHDFAFPLIGKPRHGWGGRDILHASTLEEFQVALPTGENDSYIWQRRIAGFVEWSIDFAIDAKGRISPLVKRRRIKASGGYAVISEVVSSGGPDKDAEATAQWLARSGGLGVFNIQFIEEDEKFWLSDVNPRPGTSSVSALEAGINLVAFLLGDYPSQSLRAGFLVRTLRDSFIASELNDAKGVVFDLDETIIDQKDWMIAKLGIVLAEDREISVDHDTLEIAALRVIDEGPWDRLWDVVARRTGLDHCTTEKMIDAWRQAWPLEIKVYPDAQGFAEDLAKKNIPMAIVTDNPSASQRQKLARLPAPWNTLPFVLTDDLNEPKPGIRGFSQASQMLGIKPRDLIFIGDSPWRDAVGALNAGYRAAVMVQRHGAMHNGNRTIFETKYTDFAKRISWVGTLSGLGHIIRQA